MSAARHLLDGVRQTQLPLTVLVDGLAFRMSQTQAVRVPGEGGTW